MNATSCATYESVFTTRYYETDAFGNATPAAMLTMLEDTAADHCEAIGYGLFELSRDNIGWLLLAGTMEIDRYPRYGERIFVRTWLSGYTAMRGFRENLILDGDRNPIGRANSLWVLYDIERRRPVKIPQDIRDRWGSAAAKSCERNLESPIPEPPRDSAERRFLVNGFDTDANRHANNIRYLQWALDALDPELIKGKVMRSIGGRFTDEARLGDAIVSRAGAANERDAFAHCVMARGDAGERQCASAITRWAAV